jgi:hypothetical protein
MEKRWIDLEPGELDLRRNMTTDSYLVNPGNSQHAAIGDGSRAADPG